MTSGDRLPRIWSPEAREDLFGIWSYVAHQSSPTIADKILRELDDACFALGAWPAFGKARDDIREGLRSIPVARHVVFYHVTPKAIEIVRVLDERRDVQSVFPNEYEE